MQNWKKRVLSVILALCTIAVLLPAAPALAADTEAECTHEGFTDGICSECGAINPNAVATVRENGTVIGAYTTFDDAITAAIAIENSTVVVEQDCNTDSVSADIESGTFTIDLNGKTLGSNRNFSFRVYGGNVTIIDGVGTGKTTKKLSVQGGTLTIRGGTHEYASAAQYRDNHGTLIITGGEIGQVIVNTNSIAQLSGGSYGEVAIYSGIGTLDVLLAEGYWYYDEEGHFVDPAAVEVESYWYYIYNVTVEPECKHEGEKTCTDNGDGTHSFTCSVCNGTVTEDHATELEENKATCTTLTVCDICSGEYGKILDHVMDPSTGLCGNGCMKLMAVASATIDGSTSYHETLDGAISLVSSATAEDDAEVKLLDGLTRTNGVYINRGVFTLDLNSKTLTSAEDVLMVSGSANVTIRNGTITSTIMLIPSVSADGSTVTLEDCSIIGGNFGVNVDAGATVTIRNSTVTGNNEHGVVVHDGTVTIENSTIEGKDIGVIAYDTTTISGGSVTGGNFDLYGDAIELTLNGDGKGTTFPGGICVGNCTLDALLADELAYWQDGKMVILTIGQDTIPGGDVTVMAACDHSGSTHYTDNGDGTHSFTCTVCGPVTEDHTPDETIGQTCKGYWCTVCENWYGEALGHDYKNGICTRCDDQLKSRFEDVAAGKFYFDPVEWAVEKGITTGATETTFNPDGYCQRGQVVTFLWRAAGEPEPTSTNNPFTDVNESDFYYKAVLWAVEKNITDGISDTEFGPYAWCNRAQVVTFLWRAQGSPVSDTEISFTDVEDDQFYTDAVAWAVENKITDGISATEFGVNTVCNRAQVVTFLYRTQAK